MDKSTALTFGLLTMGFLGAALLPVLQGKVADLLGLRYSFIVSILTYGFVLFFALRKVKDQTN